MNRDTILLGGDFPRPGGACGKILRMLHAIFWCMFALSLALAGAVSAQGPSTRPVIQDSNYRFGPEDVLSIEVWGRDDLTGSVTVDLDGNIQIPVLGEFRAEGRTAAELSQLLSERYQLLDSSVSEVVVKVAQYNARGVTVVGEVRSPGPYGFRQMPDLWAAILAAGGANPNADLATVQVVRANPGPDGPRVLTVDLSRGIERTPTEQLPALEPGDQILIPSSEGVPTGGDNIHILGAVNSPGVYRFASAQTVVQALSVASGPRSEADLEKVYLTRVTPEGTLAYELNIQGYLYAANPLSNFELRAGDTITVPEKSTLFSTITSGLGRLVPLASLAVTIYIATQ